MNQELSDFKAIAVGGPGVNAFKARGYEDYPSCSRKSRV
jgi:hypothetical protein